MERIEKLAEVPLPVDVELGRRKLPVREILALAPGSVLRMPREAGGLMDILVGGAPFARGEIVALDGTLHVRITDFVEGR